MHQGLGMNLAGLVFVSEGNRLSGFDGGDPTQQIAGFSCWLG